MLKFRADLGDSKRPATEKGTSAQTVKNTQKKRAQNPYEEIVIDADEESSKKEDLDYKTEVSLIDELKQKESPVSPTNIDKIHECDDRIIEENKSYPKCSINNNLLTYSGENELHDSVVSISNKAPVKTSPWIIPDVDSDDDFLKRQQNWSFEKPTSDLPHIILNSHRPFQKFSFPSDSEEDENPYSTAKSPSLSIKSAEPPLPPPVSTIPRNLTSHPGLQKKSSLQTSEVHNLQIDAAAAQRTPSITSASDTDFYDEIDFSPDRKMEPKEGQSTPRYKFTLSKGKSKLNPTDITYAEIPKKSRWNFPSSSDEEEDTEHRHTKTRRLIPRQDSAASDEGERPCVPPKIWEEPTSVTRKQQPCQSGNCQKNVTEKKFNNFETAVPSDEDDDVKIEYSPFRRPAVNLTNSLLGTCDQDLYSSLENTNSPYFEGQEVEQTENSSFHSDSSCDEMIDYEQSSACVDLDQLSLDSSGKRLKRIVETHETHEIVPADNHEDDIVERIIETQTITEKLDENRAFNKHEKEDYSKYFENDDEFVSHIFTLGRTIEKNSQKKKMKDFAFVENLFSAPDPMIETMPLEKKTVKQKITTLVKKKRAREDNIYDEVKIDDTFVPPIRNEEYDDEESYDNKMENQEESSWDKAIGLEDNSTTDENVCTEQADVLNSSTSKCSSTFEKKKEQKKSFLKGIRKLLKKKEKMPDVDFNDSLVLEEDYQEYVP